MNKAMLAIAIKGHEGQKRKYSNLPYIAHPIEVALEVQHHCLDVYGHTLSIDTMVNAAIGHDLLEDTHILEQEILDIAGIHVINLIKELTNPSKGSILSREERKSMDRQHLEHVSMEAKIIKLIDRTCNLNDMIGAPSGFVRLYLKESKMLLDVIGNVDSELAFKYDLAMIKLEESL